jgi:Protein of unknown function (DUF2934)
MPTSTKSSQQRTATTRQVAGPGAKRRGAKPAPSGDTPTTTAKRAPRQPARRSLPADPKGTPQSAPDRAIGLTPDERHTLVARAAYFRAEARGFAPGRELDDWYDAELEVNQRLTRGG